MSIEYDHYDPVRLFFGRGRINKLAETKLPGKKALIVITADGIMRTFGQLEKLFNALIKNDVDSVVFDKVVANPQRDHVMEGAALAKAEQCDFIIGLGGGSTIDSAKAIAVMCMNPGDLWDYMPGGSGKGKAYKKGLPVIAITTTAGTGSEATAWSVVTHEKKPEKIGFGNYDTFAYMSIVDPELMTSVPPLLTALQGLDAFFHSAEGYLANVATPLSDVHCLKSIELIAKSLPVAVKNGQDIQAREDVALANLLAGFVQSSSCVTSQHSIGQAISAFNPKVAHGASLLVVSRAFFKFFIDIVPQRFINMACAMGADVSSLPDNEKPMVFFTMLEALYQACGVADIKLSDYGFKKEDAEAIAKNAWDTMPGLFNVDPKKLSMEETIKIIEDSF